MMQSHSPFRFYKEHLQAEYFNEDSLKLSDFAENELGCIGLKIISIDKISCITHSFTRLGNIDPKWTEEYQAKELALVDPLLKHALNSSSRLVWDENTLESSPEFAKAAKKYGYNSGIYQSIRDIYGLVHIVILIYPEPLEMSEELDAKISHFILMVKDVLEDFFTNEKTKYYTPLSVREREILRWAALGKTAAETAIILKLSERTVNFHINNCAKKLHVRTKTQALLKALSLNFL